MKKILFTIICLFSFNSCCSKCEQKVIEKIVEKEVIKEVYVIEKEIYLTPVYFDHDKSTVMTQSIPILRRAVEVLKDNPQVNSIVIEGYTDSDCKDNYNLNLSYTRAKTVYDFIIDYNIAANKLITISFIPTCKSSPFIFEFSK